MPDTHAALVWDADGSRYYHSGVSKGVLYRIDQNGAYSSGYAWNGLISVEESPDGADTTDLWADNMKYASFRSAENYKGSISAYMYPEQFEECNGGALPTPGMKVGQQTRKPFGFCYRTEYRNDTGATNYILHLVYGATVNPTSATHDTINDNPDAAELSWDFECTPVAVTNISGVTQTCVIELNSAVVPAGKMTAIETILYGSNSADARLPLPNEIYTTLTAS